MASKFGCRFCTFVWVFYLSIYLPITHFLSIYLSVFLYLLLYSVHYRPQPVCHTSLIRILRTRIYSIFYQVYRSSLSQKCYTVFSISRKHTQRWHICGSNTWAKVPKSLLQLHRPMKCKQGWNISFYVALASPGKYTNGELTVSLIYEWLGRICLWIVYISISESYIRCFLISFTSSTSFNSCSCVATTKIT